MAELSIDEILKTLPHRYPMLLVDRIIECDDEKRIVGIKNLTFNEPFFQGHFPGNPVMPGVIQLEAMAQVAGILLNRLSKREGQIAYFTSVDKARFRRMIRPGDQMRMEVNFIKYRLGLAKVEAKSFVDGELASEGEMMFSISRN